MAVNKITGFRAPYKSDTLRDIVDSIEGLHALLDMDGPITQAGSTITLPPFRVVQDGLIFEKTVASTLSAPALSAPYYLVVTAPTPNPVDDLLFTFAKTPEDVGETEVILGAYDGFEWREAQKVSIKGILDLLAQTNIDTLRVGPFDGLRTSLDGSNYENSPGTLVDRQGESQAFNETAIFPVVAEDPDWPRVDRIVYRRPRDFAPRIGTREFLLGGTYDLTPSALAAEESFNDDLPRQTQKVLIAPDNTAHILCATGAGTGFDLEYTNVSSDRLSTPVAGLPLITGVSSKTFDAAVDSTGSFHVVYEKSGNICYQKFDDVGGSLVSETVIDTSTGACANPRLSIDPSDTKVFVVYQALMGPSNNQVFFTTRTLAGSLITAPKNLTGSAQNLITPDIFVSEDLYVYIVWENDTLGSIVYRRFDDIGNALDTAATTVSTDVEQIDVGTLTGNASNPRVLVAANRELIIVFRQDKGGSSYGLSVYTRGAAFMQELTGASESILSFDITTDPIYNSLMLTLVQASSVDFVKVYDRTVAFVLNLQASGSRGVSVARDKLGSLLHAVSSPAATTYTSYDAATSIIAFGAVSVVGAITTINVDTNQFLVDAGSLSLAPDIDDRVVITLSGIGGNNSTRLITNVELLSLDGIDDVYRVTVLNNFTAAEEPAAANGDFQAVDGNNAVYIKTVSEAQSMVFGIFELPSDILLSRIVAPGLAILNWLPPGTAGELADFLMLSGSGSIDWEKTTAGELTFTGTVKLTNIFTATEYTVAPGGYAMAEGDALYVALDPSELTPVPEVTPVPTLPWNDLIGVIGIVIDGKFEPSMPNLRPLMAQEEQVLGQSLPVAIRDRLGVVDDVNFEPYTSAEHIDEDDNYQEALSHLDTAVQSIVGQIFMTPESPVSKKVAVSAADKTFLKGSIFGLKYKERLVDFSGAVIDFATGTITEEDGVTSLGDNFTPVVPAAGMWRWYAVNLVPGIVGSDNRLSVRLKVTAASEDGASKAAAPRASFATLADIGQVAVFSADGVSISDIDHADLINLLTNFSTSEGSGGAGTGLIVSGTFTYDWNKTLLGNFDLGGVMAIQDPASGLAWSPETGPHALVDGDVIYVILDPADLTPTPQVGTFASLADLTQNYIILGMLKSSVFVLGPALHEKAIANLEVTVNYLLEQISLQPKFPNSTRVVVTGADKNLINTSVLGVQLDNYLVDFDGAEIDFQTGSIYASDGVTPLGTDFAAVIPASALWRWFAVNIVSGGVGVDGRLGLTLSVTPAAADGASQDAAVRAVFTKEPKVGQVAITSADGAVVSNIGYGNIVNVPSSIGTGGASAFLLKTAGENLALNDLVYISPGSGNGDTGRTEGSLYKVDAGNADVVLAGIRSQAVGFITGAFLSGEEAEAQKAGERVDFSGMIPGVQYYADPASPGAVTSTRPAALGQWVIPVGIPILSDTLDVNPGMGSDAELLSAHFFTMTKPAGEALSENDLVYLSPGNADGDTGRTAGSFYKVDAGNADPALALIRSQAVGFIEVAAALSDPATAQKGGVRGNFSSLTTGVQYYADPATPGAITITKPVTPGYWIVPVGIAESAATVDTNDGMASDAELIPAPTVGDSWPTAYVSSEAELTAALAWMSVAGGGVLCMKAAFSISSAIAIPSGILFIGKYWGNALTIASGGSLSMSAGSQLRDLQIISSAAGTLVTMSDTRAILRDVRFYVTNSVATTCVSVSGNYNRILECSFYGVMGPGPAVGIDYASGSENLDRDSLFA